jgi:hypothetical protein
VVRRSILALLFVVAALGACTSPSGGGGTSAAPAASAPAASAPAESAAPSNSGGY